MKIPTWSNRREAGKEAEPYVYRPVPGEGPDGNGGYTDVPGSPSVPSWMPLYGSASGPKGIAEEEAKAREKRAWDLGYQQGQVQARAASEQAVTQQRETLAQAIRDFARERHAYYQGVEAEVVRLALGIARKILHREAQIDPLLLAGVVRVALEKVAAGTSVRLRVQPSQTKVWRDFFAGQTNLEPTPELLGDPSLAPDQCVLETALGSTELALESQLKEIEQGFFDLLAHRPK